MKLAIADPPDVRGGDRLHPARRSRAGGMVPTHLIAAPPADNFAGAKPEAWTRWVLDALAFDPAEDTVDDLFPGSGAITRAIEAMTVPA